MVFWIAAGIVAVSLVGLALVLSLAVSRMRRLRQLDRRLRRRAEEAAALQEPVLALQRRAEAMQAVMVEMQERLEARARRKAPAAD